jgi:DNA primase
VRQELRTRELEDFALQHHRLLWAIISELEEDNLGAGRLESISRGADPGHDLAALDLPRLLSDRLLLERADLHQRLTPLLHPSEVQLLSLGQPLLQLRGAAAVLERQRTLRRCRHLLDAWSAQRLDTLETCIARLLGEEADSPPVDAGADGALATAGLAMEARVDALFAELNGDALRFQEAYYSERRYLGDLDRLRCTAVDELVLPPAA